MTTPGRQLIEVALLPVAPVREVIYAQMADTTESSVSGTGGPCSLEVKGLPGRPKTQSRPMKTRFPRNPMRTCLADSRIHRLGIARKPGHASLGRSSVKRLLLDELRQEGRIHPVGTKRSARWFPGPTPQFGSANPSEGPE